MPTEYVVDAKAPIKKNPELNPEPARHATSKCNFLWKFFRERTHCTPRCPW